MAVRLSPVQTRPARGHWLGWIFVGSGSICLTIALVLVLRQQQFLTHARHTTGHVIALSLVSGSKSGGSYAPVFTFRDESGREHQLTSHTSTNPPSYQVGQAVEVYYAPDKPGEAILNGFFSLWGGSVILGGIGAVHLLLGLIFALSPPGLVRMRGTRF